MVQNKLENTARNYRQTVGIRWPSVSLVFSLAERWDPDTRGTRAGRTAFLCSDVDVLRPLMMSSSPPTVQISACQKSVAFTTPNSRPLGYINGLILALYLPY